MSHIEALTRGSGTFINLTSARRRSSSSRRRRGFGRRFIKTQTRTQIPGLIADPFGLGRIGPGAFTFGKTLLRTGRETLKGQALEFARGPLRFTRRKALSFLITQGSLFTGGALVGAGIFGLNPTKAPRAGVEFGKERLGPFLRGEGGEIPGLQTPDPRTFTPLPAGPTPEPPALPSAPPGDVFINIPPPVAPSGPAFTTTPPAPPVSFGPSLPGAGLPLGLLALLGIGGFFLGRRSKKSKKKKKTKKKKKKRKTKRSKKTGRFK